MAKERLAELDAQLAERRRNGPAPLTDVEPRTLDEVVAVYRRYEYLPHPGVLYAVFGAARRQLYRRRPCVATCGWGSWERQDRGAARDLATSARLPGCHPHRAGAVVRFTSAGARQERQGRAAARARRVRDHPAQGLRLVLRCTATRALRPWPRSGRSTTGRGPVTSARTGGGHCTGPGRPAARRLHPDSRPAHGCDGCSRYEVSALPGAPVARERQAGTALGRGRKTTAMRAQLAAAVSGLFAGLPHEPELLDLDEPELSRIARLSDFTTLARSAVERDGYSREVELVPDPEMPARLALTLRRCSTDSGDRHRPRDGVDSRDQVRTGQRPGPAARRARHVERGERAASHRRSRHRNSASDQDDPPHA